MEYKREGQEAIPLGMGSVYPNAIPLGMDSGKPIPMGSKEDMEMLQQYDVIPQPLIQDEAKQDEE